MILKENYDTRTAGTAALSANQTWYTSWIDNGTSSNEVLACVSVYADQPGNLDFDQTDDPSDPNFTLYCQDAVVCPAGKLTIIQWPISHLFWRIEYQNGPTAQTVFHIVVCASANENAAVTLELQKVNFNLKRQMVPWNPKDDELNLLTMQL